MFLLIFQNKIVTNLKIDYPFLGLNQESFLECPLENMVKITLNIYNVDIGGYLF